MKRCLVIDDCEFNRITACKLIDILGLDFEDYENPFDAYEKIADGHYDAILLDWHLENNYTGIDFLKHIRNTEHGRTIPVFIYSAIEGKEGIYKAINGTADGFIPKPITLGKLTENFQAHGLI
mgnify:CR=1 FL=1